MWKRGMLACLFCFPIAIAAQNPQLAQEDIQYTKELMAPNHLIAHVELEMEKHKYVRYRYDRYPDVKQITIASGPSFAEPKEKPWMESKDWGKTGTEVSQSKAAELNRYVNIAELPFMPTEQHDSSQGAVVWKLIKHVPEKDYQFYTYEESREKPRSNAFYPRFRFIKYKDDSDGHLVLEHFSGNLIADDRLLPVEIGYESLILLPSDTLIKVVPRSGTERPGKKGAKEP
jgi:hypothetical protein